MLSLWDWFIHTRRVSMKAITSVFCNYYSFLVNIHNLRYIFCEEFFFYSVDCLFVYPVVCFIQRVLVPTVTGFIHPFLCEL